MDWDDLHRHQKNLLQATGGANYLWHREFAPVIASGPAVVWAFSVCPTTKKDGEDPELQ
jgi:hypothetical protein